MTRWLLAVLAVAMLTGCAPPADRGSDAGVTDAQRVVVVSLRGASHDEFVNRAQESGEAGTLARLVADGALTVMRPLANAETFPAMATLETGAWPARHGVVGNAYHVADDPITRTIRAYSDAAFTSETLWEAAARQGKRVVRLGTLFPADSGTHPVTSDGPGFVHSLPQAEQLGGGRVVELAAVDGGPRGGRHTQLAPRPGSPSLAIEGDADGAFSVALHATIVAAGEALGGAVAQPYARVALDDDGDPSDGLIAELVPGAWASIAVPEALSPDAPTVGTWVKLLDLDPDDRTARLYVRPAHRNRGSPPEFVSTIEAAIGFAPGAPDFRSYGLGLIDAETVLEEIDREVAYVADAALHALDRLDFDLLLIDHAVLDRIGHAFHVVDSRQAAWDADARATTEKRWRLAYRRAEADLQAILVRTSAASESGVPTGLVVTSEYGFDAAHTRISINRLISDLGFDVTADESTELRAFASTTSAHIRINRDRVTDDEATERVERLIAALRGYRDPRSGDEVFDLVVARGDLEHYGLDHPRHAGDLWVRLRSGYTFHGSPDPGRPLFDPPRFPGDHGWAPRTPGDGGLLLYLGPTAMDVGAGEVDAVDAAVTVATLLGIDPPRGSAGRNVLVRRP